MEVLTRYRTGGEQKVTSQHLSVSEVDKLSSATWPGPPLYHAGKACNLTSALTMREPMTIIGKPERSPVP